MLDGLIGSSPRSPARPREPALDVRRAGVGRRGCEAGRRPSPSAAVVRGLVLLASLFAGCGDAVVRIEILPRTDGTRVIVLESRTRAPTEVWVAHPTGPAASIPAVEGRAPLDITVLEFDRVLPLAAGHYPIAKPGEPQVRLPVALRALGASLGPDDDVPAWEVVTPVPPAFVGMPLRVTCPTELPARGPIDLPTYCPLPGPPRERSCFGARADAPSLSGAITATQAPPVDSWHDEARSVVVEADGSRWMYMVSDRVVSSYRANYTFPSRLRLVSSTEGDPSTFELVPVVLHPRAARPPRGWSSALQVRNDGLEMFFETSYPDASYWDDDLYHAWRPTLGDAWSLERADFVRSLSNADNGKDPSNMRDNDELRAPLLLPDFKTLLFVDSKPPIINYIHAARRATSDPSDVDFVRLDESVPLDAGGGTVGIGALGLSCDGRHLTYTRLFKDLDDPRPIEQRPTLAEPRIVEITRLDPLALGQPESIPVRGAPFPADTTFSEAPDCSALYFSYFSTSIAARVPCP